LRHEVGEWRGVQYGGASDTSRELLLHWFGQEHLVLGPNGDEIPFSYYFCQQEAIETLVYLYECRRIRTLSFLTAAFRGIDAERAALGVSPEEDAWPR
jgi:type III restriction enzyme